MKIIIDTNILVSAALKNNKPEQVILWVAAECQWYVTMEIIQEYQEVLQRKRLNINDLRRDHFLNLVNQLTILINTDLIIDFPRDRKDAKFLVAAMATNADYLITGDRDFSEAQKLISSQIISVNDFFNRFNLSA